jgi:general L-amino acid transport system permease protein
MRGRSSLDDPALRGLLFQLLALVLVVLAGWYLVHNTLENLARNAIASGFGFIGREAGFQIGESPLPASAADSYGRLLLAGLANTAKIALIGIVLATLLGTLVGIARLSGNWLLSRLALVYVEALRNVPLLVQLLLWYGLLTEGLPRPRHALAPLPGVFLSNRGLRIPGPAHEAVWLWALAAGLLALALAILVLRRSRRHRADTGRPLPVLRIGLALMLGLPAAVLLLGGASLEWPHLKGFNFVGGWNLSPEFTALLFGLVTYTAAFIAEIVRAGIVAVAHGQWEAALALGLPRGRVLRLVVLPQALRVIVPPLTSQYLNLTKNSSLAIAIGFPDFVSVANTTINQTGQAVEGVVLIMAVYLAVSLSLSGAMNWYNARIALAGTAR